MKIAIRKTLYIILSAAFVLMQCGCNVNIQPHDETVSNDEPKASFKEETSDETEISDNSRALRDIIASSGGLGENAICGCCINSMNVNDEKLMELVSKHFNAVTLENELKPDALFGYCNDAPPSGNIREEEINGISVKVPALDFSRADAVLDKILELNDTNPDRIIKVRGHVLVWHSQTPEWFFHVDYDSLKDYVTPEEMNLRLEWYIRSVLDHYTSKESRYHGLFYGWDVVNEAVSDRGGSYRTDAEQGKDSLSDSIHSSKSSWWKVYGDNSYIINAFRYANLYAPEDLLLFYNDYNECDKTKQKGIISLIEDVKSAEGTRLDGFGMQGHYTVYAPTADRIKEAASAYIEAAGMVMITEWDVKPSMLYDGTDEGLPKEYERQKKYYGQIYDALRELYDEGQNIAGFTFWGVCDKYTWLGNSAHPLLFDEDYKEKPAFEAFVSE